MNTDPIIASQDAIIEPWEEELMAQVGSDGSVPHNDTIFSFLDIRNEEWMALSPNVREFLTDTGVFLFLTKGVCEFFNVPSGYSTKLPSIIGNVVVGKSYIGDVVPEIQKNLRIEATVAQDMVNMILAELMPSILSEVSQTQKQRFAQRIQSPIQPPQPRPAQDPVIASQRVQGTVNLRQAPPPEPQQPRPIPPPAPMQPRPVPPSRPPQPPQQPAQTQQRPAQVPPMRSAPPSPQQPPRQTPPPQPPRQQTPPSAQRPQFRMPPVLDAEPQQNMNTDKVLNLRDTE